jgi:hypothetical protein
MSKEKFLKIYSNLPEPERHQIIVLIDDKPYTWNIAFKEISEDTALGTKILEKMEAVGLL